MNSKPLDLEANLIRISLTCTAYDGQYQSAHEGHSSGLQVTNHLCKQLDLNPKWVTSRWDGAHCIELGMDTVRKAINFYQLLASIVAGTHQRFLYGKNYDGICRAWSNFKDGVSNKSLGLQPAAIGSVCTSRFAHSERKVYKAYYRNLVIFLIELRSPERANEVGIQEEMMKIGNVVFVLQLIGIIDLLQNVKNLSLTL